MILGSVQRLYNSRCSLKLVVYVVWMYAPPWILLEVKRTHLLENLTICLFSQETFHLGPNLKILSSWSVHLQNNLSSVMLCSCIFVFMSQNSYILPWFDLLKFSFSFFVAHNLLNDISHCLFIGSIKKQHGNNASQKFTFIWTTVLCEKWLWKLLNQHFSVKCFHNMETAQCIWWRNEVRFSIEICW
jgi:hypothetical protein